MHLKKTGLHALLAVGLWLGLSLPAYCQSGTSPSPSIAPTPTVAPTPSQDPDYISIGVRSEFVVRMQQRLKDLGEGDGQPPEGKKGKWAKKGK